MGNKKRFVFLFFAVVLLCSVFYVSFVFASSDTMSVEVDILSDDNSDSDIIRVEVPDELDFGEIQKGEKSEEFKVYVNNTGNVDITVTPELTDSSETIFSYLYFRKTKTKTVNGSSQDVPFVKIGDFSFDIAKPSSGKDFNDEYFYTILDLTDYPSEITLDNLNHRTNVKFYAVAK